MKRVIAALMICCLAALLPVLASGEEGLLRGYSREEGYVYLTLGEYPQTEDGGDFDRPQEHVGTVEGGE